MASALRSCSGARAGLRRAAVAAAAASEHLREAGAAPPTARSPKRSRPSESGGGGGAGEGETPGGRRSEERARRRERGHQGTPENRDGDRRRAPTEGSRRERVKEGCGGRGGGWSAAFLEEVLNSDPGPSHLAAAGREGARAGRSSWSPVPGYPLQSSRAFQPQILWPRTGLDAQKGSRTVTCLRRPRPSGHRSVSLAPISSTSTWSRAPP